MPTEYAFVTPIPPQKTGIADYADGLIEGLRRRGLNIKVYTQSRYVGEDRPAGGALSLSVFDHARHAPTRTVYQIGNNRAFHDEQVLHLMQHGGVAHLHDFSLHHLFAWFTYVEEPKIYFALLRKWYGPVFAETVRKRFAAQADVLWETPDVLNYPLHEEVVARAHGVIVHSHFAKRFILDRFPTKPVAVVAQRYPDAEPVRRNGDRPRRIASLGFVDPYKIVDKKIEAISICRERGVEIELDVVGEVSARCENLPALAQRLGVEDLVHFHGRVSQEDLLACFRTTDACIVLRDPTVGETSAIVSRGLQYGVPMIVNDVGSYSELPMFVPKVPVGPHIAMGVADVLCRWVQKPDAYRAVAERAYRHAGGEARFARALERYEGVLHDFGR